MVYRKAIYFVISFTAAQVGSFLFFQDDARLLLGVESQISSSHLRSVQETQTSSQLRPYVPWNNESKYDLVERALEKYFAKSNEEVDLPNGIGIGGVLRMIDPMGGRTWGCLGIYFQYWYEITDDIPREPLFESFFEWLDYGEGKDFEAINGCFHGNFDLTRYRRFTATERAMSELGFDVDNTGRVSNASFVYSKKTVYAGMWLFVWGIDRKIYILDEEEERDDMIIGHASFFCGRPVLLAGEIYINEDHTIEWISDSSGHYRPTITHLGNLYKYLRDVKGVNVTTIEWRKEHEHEEISSVLRPGWFDALEENHTVVPAESNSRDS